MATTSRTVTQITCTFDGTYHFCTALDDQGEVITLAEAADRRHAFRGVKAGLAAHSRVIVSDEAARALKLGSK